MARILSVLPHAGGNVSPSLEILSELRRRGHDVLVLGHAQLAEPVAARGLGFRPFAHARPWSATSENPGLRSMAGFLLLASDRGARRDVSDAALDFQPELVVHDCMMPGALAASRRTGVPVVMVLHTLYPYWEEQWGLRSPMGLWLRATGTLPGGRLSPDLAVLTTMPELDPVPAKTHLPRDRMRQTGPAMPPVNAAAAAANGQPSILISLSTISYPGQAQLLQKLMNAVADLPITAIVTTGPSLDPASFHAPANVTLLPFVPHDEVLPTVQLLVGHGGHGTAMRALAYGVPVLIVPMSSVADHHMVAAAIEGAGAGGSVSKHATAEELGAAIMRALEQPSVRDHAAELGRLLRSRSGASEAADAIEGLLPA